jgi:hypothetical protein
MKIIRMRFSPELPADRLGRQRDRRDAGTSIGARARLVEPARFFLHERASGARWDWSGLTWPNSSETE